MSPTRPAGKSLDQVAVHYVDANATARTVTLDEVSRIPFETALLVRPIRNFYGQRNTVGFYWSSTTGQHVEFESHLESCWLTIFDFDPTVTAMAAQPFRLTGIIDGQVVDHVPDFFLRRDGRGVVVDVRAEALQDHRFANQVAATARFCELAGFDYEIRSEPDPQWWSNVSFLSGYRRSPDIGLDYVDRLLELARKPVPFRQLAASFVDDPLIARGVVLHLCWRLRLTFDLNKPLTLNTPLVALEVQ